MPETRKSTTDRTARNARTSSSASGRVKADPARSGNPAKAARAAGSQGAGRGVSRTPRKVKDTASPTWYAPTMVTFMVVGLLWVVVTYLFKGQYPLPWFMDHHASDWLSNGNLYLGFLVMLVGFLGLLRWK